MRAYVLVTTRPGTSEEVLPKLKETRSLKGVVSADSVFGKYEAIVVLDSDTLEEIGNAVYQVVEKSSSLVSPLMSLVVAYVLVKTKHGSSKEIVSLKLKMGLQIALSVLGQHDIVLVVSADNNEDISKTIYKVMERHPNVDHVETLLSVYSPA